MTYSICKSPVSQWPIRCWLLKQFFFRNWFKAYPYHKRVNHWENCIKQSQRKSIKKCSAREKRMNCEPNFRQKEANIFVEKELYDLKKIVINYFTTFVQKKGDIIKKSNSDKPLHCVENSKLHGQPTIFLENETVLCNPTSPGIPTPTSAACARNRLQHKVHA